MRVVNQPVENRISECRISDGSMPAVDWNLTGDDHRTPAVPVGPAAGVMASVMTVAIVVVGALAGWAAARSEAGVLAGLFNVVSGTHLIVLRSVLMR